MSRLQDLGRVIETAIKRDKTTFVTTIVNLWQWIKSCQQGILQW
jgi:hypothetical protein